MTSRSELGRQTQDRITTLASGADGAVRRISTTYEVRGMVNKLTSYDNATVGSGSVVNEVQHAYNSFGQLTTQYQEHAAGVNTGTSPKVQYAYADGSANHVRPTKITYPSGRIVRYEYGSSTMDDYLSRISYLADDSSGSIGTHLAEYTYLGLATVVKVDYTEPDVRLDWAFGTGDDPYDGLDRFDRVQDQRWYDYGASADAARIKHGYDRAGNRLWREDTVAAANSKNFDELYAYDGIYRLKDFQRGDLNSSKTGISTGTLNFEHQWGFDPLGNWTSFKEDAAGDGTFELDQTRTVNKANEITGISGGSWTVPAYDRSGNMTTMPQPATPTASYTATYDAWNRLVKLVDGSNTVAEYQYDGQNWRTITKSYTSGTLSETRHHYYSSQWQAVEERVGTSTNPNRQFVWGLRYIDDLVLRDRDTSSPADGTLDERLYALHDANWNVIALTDTAGDAQERYLYSAYGQATILTGTFASRSSSSYAWETRYGGYRWDMTSELTHIRNRDLAIRIGTWISRDRSNAPANVNLYIALGNNPYQFTDPMGLDLWGIWPYRLTGFWICRNTINIRENATCTERCGQASGAKHCDIGYEVRPCEIELVRHGRGGAQDTCKLPCTQHCPLYEKSDGVLASGYGKGTPCKQASAHMIYDCVKTNPVSPSPFDHFRDNCQTDTYDTARACCMQPGWTCFIPAVMSRSACKQIEEGAPHFPTP